MPHVTFIHGIANKPEAGALRRAWERALAADDGLDLGTAGVTTSMVYWADVLYAEAAPSPFESAATLGPEASAALADDAGWDAALPPDEADFVGRMEDALGVGAAPEANGGADALALGAGAAVLERVPLPWVVKRPLMKLLLRDVHHYLFNTTHSPRPGDTYAVRDEIRRRVVEQLTDDAAALAPGDRHVLVSHSMGTVIAYDCLRRAPGCPGVDALVTVGSPLGLDEIQDQFRPEWTRDDGFPAAAEVRQKRWVNVYDRLDPVCGFDPVLGDDYRRGGVGAVEDVAVSNVGRWRHGFDNYAARDGLREPLRDLLGLPAPL